MFDATPLIITDINGVSQTVIADRGHRATVVIQILDGCPIARKFSPEIKSIYSQYSKKSVQFFLVQEDPDTSAKTAAMFNRDFGLNIPTLLSNRKLRERTGAKAVPTVTIFAPDGHKVYSGRIDDRFPVLGGFRPPKEHDLRRALDQWLAGRTVKPTSTPVVGCALGD